MIPRTPLVLNDTFVRREKVARNIGAGASQALYVRSERVPPSAPGNYRTCLYEDVLQKYLECHGYSGERMVNFTDMEDKAVAECREEGKSLEELVGPVEIDAVPGVFVC